MKKLSLITFISILAGIGFALPAFASCTPITIGFPTTLDTFTTGTCIPSVWANNLEPKMGVNGSTVTSSLDFQINSLFTSWGSEIFASSSIAFPWINFGTVGLPSSTWAKVANNLSDLASASTARTNLGLGTMATQAVPSAALVLSNGTNISAYTGATCSSGNALSTLSATGSGTCSPFLTSLAAGTGISVSGNTITNTGVTSFNGSTGAVTGVSSLNSATGSVSLIEGSSGNIAIQTTTTSTAILAAPLSIEDLVPTTSTPDVFHFPNTTTTISKILCNNLAQTGNTYTFGLIASTTIGTGSATNTVLSAGMTCNSTTTDQSTTTFSNATIPPNAIGQIWYSVASTTGAIISIYF